MAESRSEPLPIFKRFQFFILVILVSYASVGAVVFSPALPAIQDAFMIRGSHAQFVITFYLIGFTFGQLIYGPLSNRYGRKPFLLIGITIAGLCCFLGLFAAHSHNYFLLVLARFLMALGASASLKLGYNIAADIATGDKLTKLVSYFVLSFSIAPPVSISIAGLLTTHFGWISIFYFILIYTLLMILLTLFLPETLKQKDPDAMLPKKVLCGFKKVLSEKAFVLGSFVMGTGASTVYLFAAAAPFIGMHIIGMSAQAFGGFTFLTNLGLLFGASLAAMLAKRYPPLTLINVGGSIIVIGALANLFLFLFGIIHVWSLFIPISVVYVGASLSSIQGSSLALMHAADKSYGSSLLAFINMGTCSFFSFLLHPFPARDALILPSFLTLLSLLMFALRFGLKKTARI